MNIQKIHGSNINNKLHIEWCNTSQNYHAISVQVGQNIDMTKNMRHFVLPTKSVNCDLDVGSGTWYYRLGIWEGEIYRGRIFWSGVYGPINIPPGKPIIPEQNTRIYISRTQANFNSFCFYSDIDFPYYAVIDYTISDVINSGNSHSCYELSRNEGSVNCYNLNQNTPYLFKISFFEKNFGDLPSDSIKQLCQGVLIPKKLPRNINEIQKNAPLFHSDRTLVRDVKDQQITKFITQGDYIKYLEAKARTSGTIEYSLVPGSTNELI